MGAGCLVPRALRTLSVVRKSNSIAHREALVPLGQTAGRVFTALAGAGGIALLA
jgi:hypothetical protein